MKALHKQLAAAHAKDREAEEARLQLARQMGEHEEAKEESEEDKIEQITPSPPLLTPT